VAQLKAAEPAAPSFGARLRPRPVERGSEAEDDVDLGDGPPPDDAPPPWMEADDAPAVNSPFRVEPEAPRRVELRETPEGAQWAERVAAANIVGMTGELARQAQALKRETVDGREVWTLRVERESLRAPALVAKLEAALNAKLQIEAGVAEDTISLRNIARVEGQQRAAVALAAAHPMTRTLLSQFPSARILPGSVQPVLPPTT
jgi:DNA polymerase-3 subunit gamma/tau